MNRNDFERSKEKRSLQTLNYNDRADGYGFGEAESMDFDQPYEQEKGRRPRQRDDHDELGLPQQYGEMDQYSFREPPLRNRPRGEENRAKPRATERFDNDDFSRYAGADYREVDYQDETSRVQNRDRFSYRESGSRRHPGVSGKDREEGTWVNPREYDVQRSFMGKGPKGYRRTDDRIYDEVCSELMDSHEIDATDIGVKVEEGIVTLEGRVESRYVKKLAERTIEDLPGVLDVRNELCISDDKSDSGESYKAKGTGATRNNHSDL